MLIVCCGPSIDLCVSRAGTWEERSRLQSCWFTTASTNGPFSILVHRCRSHKKWLRLLISPCLGVPAVDHLCTILSTWYSYDFCDSLILCYDRYPPFLSDFAWLLLGSSLWSKFEPDAFKKLGPNDSFGWLWKDFFNNVIAMASRNKHAMHASKQRPNLLH